MNYLPMHAVLNPNRVLIFFVYVGAVVEAITAAGAAKNAAAGSDIDKYKCGGEVIAAGLVLQAVVECLVVGIVATVHVRATRARMVSRNVQTLCITLYGTSTLVLLRCVFCAVEAFEMFDNLGCVDNCGSILSNEWYLFAFELGPMLIFTYWLSCYILDGSCRATNPATSGLMVELSGSDLAGLIAEISGRPLSTRLILKV